jgi:hypothetical protein
MCIVMSTPRSLTKRKRLSTKLHTPGSVFGIRKRDREKASQENDSQVQYTVRPERLYFNVNDSNSDLDNAYDGLEGM